MPKFDVHMEASAAVIRGSTIVEAATLEEAIAKATADPSGVDWVVMSINKDVKAAKVYNYDTGRVVFRGGDGTS